MNEGRNIRRGACAALFALAGALSACGGSGGGSESSASRQPVTEGVYSGTLADNESYDSLMVVALEDGSFWAPYGNTVAGQLQPEGFVEGSVTTPAASGWKSSDALAFDWRMASYAVGVNATMSATGMSGTLSDPSGSPSFGFDVAPLTASSYDYDASASTGAIAGQWTVVASFGGNGGVLLVNPDSSVSGEIQGLCDFGGKVASRASGKNVFDVSLGAGCAGMPALTGIAIALPQGDGHQHLIVMLKTAARDTGLVMSATR
jgi:hypothetical protein